MTSRSGAGLRKCPLRNASSDAPTVALHSPARAFWRIHGLEGLFTPHCALFAQVWHSPSCQVTIVRNETGGNHIATVVVRASTDNIADDIERAIEDGVNAYKVRSCSALVSLMQGVHQMQCVRERIGLWKRSCHQSYEGGRCR